MSPDSGFGGTAARLHVVVERDIRARHELDAGDGRAALEQVGDPGVFQVVGRDQLSALGAQRLLAGLPEHGSIVVLAEQRPGRFEGA
ncbi:MAG TPA: hypothetical protein VGF76_21585 [Polyangiaceae bacterium]